MNPQLLKLYHRLPSWAQSAAATARGWQLNRWRYSSETERLIQEAVDRETWRPEQWEAWRQPRLFQLLRRARYHVPYYRDYWERQRDDSRWKHLENWPILEKDQVRENPLRFVADDCDLARMFPEHTSGSTGKPLHLWWSRETVGAWYALFEARWKRWYGVSRLDRWGMLGGQLVVPASRRRPPFWVWNAAQRQLYMSSFHLTAETIPYYLDAIERYRLRYLFGYSSSLFEVAARANELGRRVPLHVVITNAEPLHAHQREAIAKTFCCPVRETYGMAEIVASAGECQAGRLHLWPETGVIEILDQGEPVRPGEAGELVATGLVNRDMPLIRYRVGDRLALEPASKLCECGRTLPLLRSVEGRQDDVIVTPDGRRVGRLDVVFKADLPIRGAQVIQQQDGTLHVRIVPAPHYTRSHREQLRARFRDYLGPIEVELIEVAEIPREANGKVRGVICKLPPGQRHRVGITG